MSTATCAVCGHSGYLLDQTYGEAVWPADWLPVQACDACERGRGLSDEVAARLAAVDCSVHLAWFPAPPAEDGESGHGEWCVGPMADGYAAGYAAGRADGEYVAATPHLAEHERTLPSGEVGG